MRIAIISPYQTVNPHFEAELEILQRHLDAGDQVMNWSCLGQQSLCDFNMTGNQAVCESCVSRRAMGLDLLSHHVANRPLMTNRSPFALPAELSQPIETLEQLRSLMIDNFDIGYASLSSLVSWLRDPAPDLRLHQPRLQEIIANSWAVYQATLQKLENEKPDRVYVFNGRFAVVRAVLRATQRMSVDCFIHERGSTHGRFQLYKNRLPHDIDYILSRMNQFWDQAEPETRMAAGNQWFVDRRNRIERGWKSFVREQQADRLPADWSNAHHNVVLFCSSEDEFAAIGDSWDKRPYPSQLAGLKHLLLLLQNPQAKLTVRLHPNLKTAPRSLYEPFLNLVDSRLSVITPESPIDSYALLEHADTCVTFGSSVGVEAIYYQKPSILLGPCFYQDLVGTYQPLRDFVGDASTLSHQHPAVLELAKRLNQPQDSMPIDGALRYGFWMQEHGIDYQYYQGTAFNEGTFAGQAVYPKPKPKSFKGKWRQFWSGKKPQQTQEEPADPIQGKSVSLFELG